MNQKTISTIKEIIVLSLIFIIATVAVASILNFHKISSCEHKWEYTDNNDGTHTKRCVICQYEIIEDHYPVTGPGCYKCEFCSSLMRYRADFFRNHEEMTKTHEEERQWLEETQKAWSNKYDQHEGE